MTGRLFPHRATVRRATPVGTNGRMVRSEIATGLPALFTPMASRAEIEQGYSPGVGYDIYCNPDADVRMGDQLVWEGQTFNVRGTRLYSVPRIGHLHVLAAREGA